MNDNFKKKTKSPPNLVFATVVFFSTLLPWEFIYAKIRKVKISKQSSSDQTRRVISPPLPSSKNHLKWYETEYKNKTFEDLGGNGT